ncbi:hypothetical protein ACFS2C_16150 [Prauserella oleivorans]|uniref:Uncharacterized protein n=1 Tax=Prauserella oleivorans TaxID=1478153 RepID=A0ABW5WCP4_9PSEU
MSEQADPSRIRSVVRNFEFLQGLAVVPVAVWCAVAVGWADGWLPGWLVAVGAAVAVVAAGAAILWYRRHYGRVRPAADAARGALLVWPAAGVILAAMVVRALELPVPVSVEGLVLAAGALAAALWLRQLTPALLAVAGLVAAASLLPLGGPDGPHPLSDTENWTMAFCAAVAIVAGWSHLVLRRTLGPGGR